MTERGLVSIMGKKLQFTDDNGELIQPGSSDDKKEALLFKLEGENLIIFENDDKKNVGSFKSVPELTISEGLATEE